MANKESQRKQATRTPNRRRSSLLNTSLITIEEEVVNHQTFSDRLNHLNRSYHEQVLAKQMEKPKADKDGWTPIEDDDDEPEDREEEKRRRMGETEQEKKDEDEESKFEVVVKVVADRNFVVRQRASNTVEQLMEYIRHDTGIATEDQCLIFRGLSLHQKENLKRSLVQVGVTRTDNNIQLIRKHRSGMLIFAKICANTNEDSSDKDNSSEDKINASEESRNNDKNKVNAANHVRNNVDVSEDSINMANTSEGISDKGNGSIDIFNKIDASERVTTNDISEDVNGSEVVRTEAVVGTTENVKVDNPDISISSSETVAKTVSNYNFVNLNFRNSEVLGCSNKDISNKFNNTEFPASSPDNILKIVNNNTILPSISETDENISVVTNNLENIKLNTSAAIVDNLKRDNTNDTSNYRIKGTKKDNLKRDNTNDTSNYRIKGTTSKIDETIQDTSTEDRCKIIDETVKGTGNRCKIIPLEVNTSQKIVYLKDLIAKKTEGFLPENMRLVFGGKILDGEKSLDDYCVPKKSTILVHYFSQ